MQRSASKKAHASGLSGAVKLVVRFFLEQDHYRQMARILSDQWSGSHSLVAAVKLMEAHGVKMTPEEEGRLSQLSEERMIDAFVCRMPQSDRDTFDHFFTQLSLICSCTTELRKALVEGDAEVIEDVLEGAENTGILSYMLKMFVAQAGTDCRTKEVAHDEWLQEAREKMCPLLQAQSTAMVIHKALAEANAKFGSARQDANSKSKKVLMGMCAKSSQALLTTVVASWADLVKTTKREAVIREEYEEEIQAAEGKLIAYKAAQVANIRNVLNRSAARDTTALLELCFKELVDNVEEVKRNAAMTGAVQELEDKLKSFAAEAAENAKKVLTGMNAGNDASLVTMVFGAWQKFRLDYLQNKDMEDAVKAAEQKLKDFEQKHKDDARGVLSRMTTASESGMRAEFFQAWASHVLDEKKAALLAEGMQNKGSQLGDFKNRNKSSAMSEMLRMALCEDIGLMIACTGLWKKEAKVEGTKRLAREKNAKKKSQLIGVKTLFKNFASELDTNLKNSTPRLAPGASPPQARSGPRSGRSRTHASPKVPPLPEAQASASPPPPDAPLGGEVEAGYPPAAS